MIPCCVSIDCSTGFASDKGPFGVVDKEGIWPIRHGVIKDPHALRLLIRHVLGLLNQQNLSETSLLIILPSNAQLKKQNEVVRGVLAPLDLAAVYIAEPAVMAAWGCALQNALVIDIGAQLTEVSAVWEGQLIFSESSPLAGEAIDRLVSGSGDLSEEELRKKKQKDDLNDILKKVFLQEHPSIVELVRSVLAQCEPEQRPSLLDRIIITGGSSACPSLSSIIEEALRTDLLAASEFTGDHQPRSLRIRTVPEYYPEIWRTATPQAAWFGGGVTAKCVFSDSRYVEKLVAEDP